MPTKTKQLKPLMATVLYKDKDGKLRSVNEDMIKYFDKVKNAKNNKRTD